MSLSNICRLALVPIVKTPVSLSLSSSRNGGSYLKAQIVRSFKTNPVFKDKEAPQFVRRAKERMGLKERLSQPTSGAPFGLGQGAVAGAALFGLGALGYYGLGLSKEVGALERSMLWPQYVKDRIKTTYMYFGGSIVLTAAAAAAAFRSTAMMNIMMKNSWMVLGGSLVALIGTGMVARGIPYEKGFGMKQLAWMLHSGAMGVVIAPMCMVGGPILLRAAWMTAGIIGGLSTIAVCAPSEKFLTMGAPLGIGLGLVFASSLASMFLAPTTAIGAGLYSISLYGGLILFSGFLLYDTQRIMQAAEMIPQNSPQPYDPVNASISIYLDTMNIFIRIVQMLAMGGGGRKK